MTNERASQQVESNRRLGVSAVQVGRADCHQEGWFKLCGIGASCASGVKIQAW